MPPRSYCSVSRSAAAEKTRQRIVAAAAKLLRSRGIEDFSLESVAKSARVTRLTVYNHLGSRRALFEAVFDDRAAKGGLFRLREAMTDPDPRSALNRLIVIFCDFWSFDKGAIARLHGVGSSDAEFEEAIGARNERRRAALAGLVRRMVERKDVRAEAAADLSDLLFVLTSFSTFTELNRKGRQKNETCALIQRTADDAIRRAAST